MKLIKCYVENFGLLHGQEFSFSKGLNCCISENGTGKTTLTAFIEAMLYGIGDTRRQSLDENPRKKYAPWQGGRFGGSLTIEIGRKRYTVERSFGQKAADDTFRLIETDTGRVSEDFGEDIGERIFGIDRDGFLRTVFLSEKNLQGKNENKSISAKLSDLVGVDGDVGGIDDAIKLLEERRRFYFKKGNTGEIANVKERINECQRKLDALDRLEAETEEKDARLIQIREEKERLFLLGSEEKRKLAAFEKIKARSQHEERYAAMLAELAKEKARFDEVKEYFATGLPSTAEIDGARDAYMESKRLKDEALAESGNEEYVALGEFFKCGTDFVEIADIERAAMLASEEEKKISAIDNGFDTRALEMRRLFADRPPAEEELKRAESMAKRHTSPVKAIVALLGILLAIGGVITGETYGYVAAGIGVIVAIVASLLALKPNKNKELLAFIRKYGECDCAGSAKAVSEIRQNLERYNELKESLATDRQQAYDEYNGHNLKVYAFLGKFPLTDADSVLGSVQAIKHKYTRYYALSEADETVFSGKLEKLRRSEELAKRASAFISRFPVSSSDPFAEIRERLGDYSYLRASLMRMEKDCDHFAEQYGVTGKATVGNVQDELAAKNTLEQISNRIRALDNEYALIERELNIQRGEIEKRDEYLMAKEELEELYARYVDNLEIIKKTSACLKEACDNITSKYLGKTKEKFIEYSSLIAGAAGEYSLSTSFELSKTERGEYHGIEAYSRGTRDLYALGLRLALVDALYEKESPFIILDDPFVALDDAKLERAKATLKAISKGKQILYFTCSKAREIV